MVEHQGYAIESDDVPIVYVTDVLVERDDAVAPPAAAESNKTNSQDWICPVCTLLNSKEQHSCEACQNPGPALYQYSEEELLEEESEDEEGNFYESRAVEENDPNNKGIIAGNYFYSANNDEIYEVEEVVDLGESPWNKKIRRRFRRKGRMCAGALGGAVIGGALGCGVGAFAGAIAGGIIARRVSKRRTKKG